MKNLKIRKYNFKNITYLFAIDFLNNTSLEKDLLLISLSGGQGSGKSTIAQILKIVLQLNFNLNVVCFSIDDFYKTSSERKKMSKYIHPLFLTRGVPGTHDCKMLYRTINALLKKNLIP